MDERFPVIWAIKNLNNETVMKSSSGGVFYEMARYILNQSGIVYGAAFSAVFSVEHQRIQSLEEIESIMGSKYVQSNMSNCIEQVLDDLIFGKKVLFSGTPCQVAGLKSVLSMKNVNTSNLVTVDLVCHGAPSPDVFQWYTKNLKNKNGAELVSYSFRNKESGSVQAIKAMFKNGKEYCATTTEDLYYKLFLYDYILRDSCYQCPYTNMNRVGDITIGDFWGYKGKFDASKGLSLVFANSDVGMQLINNCKETFEMEISDAQDCKQAPLYHPCKEPKLRKVVLFLLKKEKYTGVKLMMDCERVIRHFGG